MYNEPSWLRLDTLTSSVYYGYSPNINAADTDSSWSIKKITTSGTVQSVTWTNGYTSPQISIWQNRYNSFSSPTSSVGITWSVASINAYSNINLGWNLISGVDVYQIIIKDTSGNIYSDGGYPIYNNQNNNNLAMTYQAQAVKSYIYKFGNPGTTYSVQIIAVNVAGSTSSIVTIGV